jgi:hypothetical protein
MVTAIGWLHAIDPKSLRCSPVQRFDAEPIAA